MDLVRQLLAWVETLGPWAPVALGAAFVPCCVLLLPCLPLTLAAGALFGFWKGLAVVAAGGTLGAAAAFAVARLAGRRRLEPLIARYPSARAFDAAMAKGGARVIFFLRMSPVVPFIALNYAAGLSPVNPRDYMVVTCVGMLPGSALYVYLGSLAAAAAAGEAGLTDGWRWAFYAVGLAATVAAVWTAGRLARRELERI